MARPKTISPSNKECIKLGKELVEWAKVNDKDDPRMLFGQWYCMEKGILRRNWKALIRIEVFRPYYEQARIYLARRAMDGTMEKSFGHRYLRIYDQDVVEEEDGLLEKKADLARKQEEAKSDPIREIAQFVKDSKRISGTEGTGKSEVETQ